jgi:hypothetical protein
VSFSLSHASIEPLKQEASGRAQFLLELGMPMSSFLESTGSHFVPALGIEVCPVKQISLSECHGGLSC